MPSLNKVLLIGHITRDIELKYTPKGSAIADFGLAMNHTWTTDAGEKKESVTFADITFWGKSAETLGQYCKKGQPLFVEGRLQQDVWQDKETGAKRSKLKIIGDNFQFLAQRESQEGQGERQEQRQQARPPQKRPPVDPDLDAPENESPF